MKFKKYIALSLLLLIPGCIIDLVHEPENIITFNDCQCDILKSSIDNKLSYEIYGISSELYWQIDIELYLSLYNKTNDVFEFTRNKLEFNSEYFEFFFSKDTSFTINPNDSVKIIINTFAKEKAAYEDVEFASDSEVVDLQLNMINKTTKREVKEEIKFTLHNL